MFAFETYTNIETMEKFLPDNWQKVHGDQFYHVYKDNTGKYTAIVVCDDNGYIGSTNVVKKQSDGTSKSIYLYNGLYSNVRTYSDIIFTRNVDKIIEQKHGKTPEWVRFDRKRVERNVYRNYHKKFSCDPYSVPVLNSSKEWRTVSEDNGEYCTDFIIIPDEWSGFWETEDEQIIYDDIEQFVYDTVGYDSCYDFPTGKMITLSWRFKRVPCGVAIIHRRGIDW